MTARREIPVQVLWVEGCPHCQTLLRGVEALLARTGHPARVELRRVRSAGEARALRFLGSPTLRIDGRDVDPAAEGRTDYGIGCRLYSAADGMSGTPPAALVLRALEAAAASGAAGSVDGETPGPQR